MMMTTEQVLPTTAGAEVTVPNDDVFKADPVIYELTEYAADLGARVVDEYNDEQGVRHAIGETWVSGTAGHHPNDAVSYWDAYYLPKDQVFVREMRASGDGQVGVAPCFVNPEALGMSITQINGQEFLATEQGVAYYPQIRVRDGELSRALSQCKAAADEQEELADNIYNLPRYQRDSDSAEGQVGCLPVRCYEYQGGQFVYVNGQWYKSEPIQVRQRANGDYESVKLLFSSPHGGSRGDNTLYSFLNKEFLADLRNHSKTKLTQLQLGLAAALAPNCER